MSSRRTFVAFLLVAGTLLLPSFLGCGGGRPKFEPRSFGSDSDDETTEVTAVAPPTVAAPPPSEVASANDTAPSNAEKPPTAVPATKTVIPPAQPESMATNEERFRQSADNLARIAEAMRAYVEEHGRFPDLRHIHVQTGRPSVSWRVMLLPYLGHADLFAKFDLAEPFDSEHNSALIGAMPDVYRDPAVRNHGGRTPYLLISGVETFFPKGRGKPLADAAVHMGDTVILTEVRTDFMVPWSSPEDLSIDRLNSDVFFQKLDGQMLGAFGNGRVARFAFDPVAFRARREKSPIAELTMLSPSKFDMEVLAARFGLSASPSSGGDETSSTINSTTAAAAHASAESATATPPRETQGATVPTELEQREARELVKEMFLKRYKVAENDSQKREIAAEMVAKSSQIGNDLPGKYVMLVTAQRIALEAGDIETARSALDQLLGTFDVDAYDMQVKLLRKTDSISHRSSFDTPLLDQAVELVKEAVQRDDYATASDMADVALEAARRVNDAQAITKVTRLKRNIEHVAASHKEVHKALAGDANATPNPATSALVGRHYCFMKDDWEKGVPYLAGGDDPDLRRLAQRELEAPDTGEKKLAIADGWYTAAQKARTTEGEAMLGRALMWYEAAQGDLPEGLPKLKAELRITELRNRTRK